MTFKRFAPAASERVAPNRPPDGRALARWANAGVTATTAEALPPELQNRCCASSARDFVGQTRQRKHVENCVSQCLRGVYVTRDKSAHENRVAGKQPDVLLRVLPANDVVVVELEAPLTAAFRCER